MGYYFSKTLKIPFEEAVERTIAALKQHEFGVLTRIDVKNTLKERIGAEFRPYVILGACTPPNGAPGATGRGQNRDHAPVQRDYSRSRR